jgi:hypothetical protein
MYPVEGAITKNGKQHYSFYGSLSTHPELAGDSVSFVVLVNNASVAVSKIVDNGLSVLSTKPVLRLLLISLLALLTIIICHVIKV